VTDAHGTDTYSRYMRGTVSPSHVASSRHASLLAPVKKKVRPNRPSSFNRRRGRPRIPERPKADCAGLPQTWMHEQNGLSTRHGLLQAADCQCPRRCAREGCFQPFSGIGLPLFSTISRNRPTLRCEHMLLGASLGTGSAWVARTHCVLSAANLQSWVQDHPSFNVAISRFLQMYPNISRACSPLRYTLAMSHGVPGRDQGQTHASSLAPTHLQPTPSSFCSSFLFTRLVWHIQLRLCHIHCDLSKGHLAIHTLAISPHSTTAARNCPHAYLVAPSQYFVFWKRRLPGGGFICTRLCSRVFAIVTASCAVSNRESWYPR